MGEAFHLLWPFALSGAVFQPDCAGDFSAHDHWHRQQGMATERGQVTVEKRYQMLVTRGIDAMERLAAVELVEKARMLSAMQDCAAGMPLGLLVEAIDAEQFLMAGHQVPNTGSTHP